MKRVIEYPVDEVDYPCSDGLPMADSTLQFDWIETIKGGLEFEYRDDDNVFVAGDLLWYPVRGNNRICAAPDAMVVFGRPKGTRDSYLQFFEDNVAPQFVFEIALKSNDPDDRARKFLFYDTYGVEEFYQYDARKNKLEGWIRQGISLVPIENVGQDWISPRTGLHFNMGETLVLTTSDGHRLMSYLQLGREWEKEAKLAEAERKRTEKEKKRAEAATRIAELERQKVDKLREKLKSLGIDPDTIV